MIASSEISLNSSDSLTSFFGIDNNATIISITAAATDLNHVVWYSGIILASGLTFERISALSFSK